MHTRPALIAIERSQDNAPQSISEALRALLAVLEKKTADLPREPYASNSPAEEVLVDTEVDGCRYLVVRMPPARNRIQLSPREQEIVRMVAKGHPNKVIADVLNISSWTVCTHLRRIFAKLGVGSRAAMVAHLLETGTLTPDHRTSEKAMSSSVSS